MMKISKMRDILNTKLVYERIFKEMTQTNWNQKLLWKILVLYQVKKN